MHIFSSYQFDVVYSSWLSRAIETAWLVLNELDCLSMPVVKTWRLNERMCKCPNHTFVIAHHNIAHHAPYSLRHALLYTPYVI
ncbi:hypothetical protein EON65_18490 [archaeon]|nr:MAG: hypothetical protein EON65_18490 [archaeon]